MGTISYQLGRRMLTKGYLPVREAADRFDYSRFTVYSLISRGQVRHKTVRRALFVEIESLHLWVNGGSAR
jgi:hypothetical protein